MLIVLTAPSGLWRDGIVRIVRELGSSVEIRCVDDPMSACAQDEMPHLIILDGDAHSNPEDVVGAVRDKMPLIPVVVLFTSVVRSAVDKLLEAGTAGCVDKSASSAVFLGALRVVLGGGIYLPPSLLSVMAGQLRPPVRETSLVSDASRAHGSDLTPRQVEVLALAARGESNKAIARQLSISEGTVKIHLTAVYRALKVSSRCQATNIAIRRQNVVDQQVRQAFGDNRCIGRLMPHMTPRKVRMRTTLFTKGDIADSLYFVVRGVIYLEHFELDMGPGTLLGEVGLFTPEHRRTSTAWCKTDSELLWISAPDAMRVLYQDPEFAIYVMHLITSRLRFNMLRAQGVKGSRSDGKPPTRAGT